MKLTIRVKPNSKEEKVDRISENEFVLRVKAKAREGKANEAAIRLLSEYFSVPKNKVAIIAGRTSRNKIIYIL